MNGLLGGTPMSSVIRIMGAVLFLSLAGIVLLVVTGKPIPPVLDDVAKMSLTALGGLLAGTRGTNGAEQTSFDAPAGSTVTVEPPAGTG